MRMVTVLLVAFFLARAQALLTCPYGVVNCNPRLNECKICHYTCKYCQRIGSDEVGDECGPEDCMACVEGLRFLPLFEDGTGECTDRRAIYKPTCPEGVSGCLPENKCDVCHPTCHFCQGDEEQCGIKDCMSCRQGYVHHALFTDETGECLPPGVKPERHEITCPEEVPGCTTDNRCLTCDASCATCHSTATENGDCSSSDCLTCNKGAHFEPVLGNTGHCVTDALHNNVVSDQKSPKGAQNDVPIPNAANIHPQAQPPLPRAHPQAHAALPRVNAQQQPREHQSERAQPQVAHAVNPNPEAKRNPAEVHALPRQERPHDGAVPFVPVSKTGSAAEPAGAEAEGVDALEDTAWPDAIYTLVPASSAWYVVVGTAVVMLLFCLRRRRRLRPARLERFT